MISKVKVLPDLASRAASNPRLAIGEVRKYAVKANARLHQLGGIDGVDVMAEDWDNLLLLDGCRVDAYTESEGRPDDPLETRFSRASTSQTFIERNFNGRELHDTVYVTANPYVKDLDLGVFHTVVNVLDEWDDDLQTVPPAAVTLAARAAHDRYPEKRLIVHFMQPHYPFIGPTGRELTHRGYHLEHDGELPPSVWRVLQYGYEGYEDVTHDRVWNAYIENLEIVLEHVDELLDTLVGRTVISADHGNLLGERVWPIPARAYGHPKGLRAPELVEVPWHVIEDEERKFVVSEPPINAAERVDGDVEAQLKALGYR